jgi:PAS domain S-box-containing protein
VADPTQKPDKRDSRVGEPVSGTYENPGSRPAVEALRESRPDRAWPIPQDRPLRESISAPRPSHLPAPEWTLDAALRAGHELEADLREKADEPEIARAFVDALRLVLPGVEVGVRMFAQLPRGGELLVSWYVASAELSDASPQARVAISRAALLRSRALAALLGEGNEPTESGVTVPSVRIVERAEPIVRGTSEAIDVIAADGGQPIAIVTLESNDAARLRPLEPVLALFAEKLGAAIGRLRVSQNEEFLRRYLQEMFEHARGPIIAIAPDRTVRAVNRPALALIEAPLEAVLGKDLVAILRSEEHRERVGATFEAVLAGRSTASFELRITKRDGSITRTRWNTATILDTDGTVGAIVAMGEDLSDVQRLELQILHAEKLATLGQLAAGVLHELNNPLTSITVYSEYLLGKGKRGGADPSDLDTLGRIVESAARMTKFTRDLVTYARPSSETAAKVSMIEVLEQSLGFCEHVLDEAGVLVERSYAQDLAPIEAVRGQLHQIFVNLITNASQAMANDPRRGAIDAPRPKLSVAVEGKSVEGRPDTLVVRISDNGPGIPAENLARIFEPFFTTKGEGKGTGLGLSIVRNLVEQHGGTISVESRTEAGRETRTSSAGTTLSPSTQSTGTSFELRFRLSS